MIRFALAIVLIAFSIGLSKPEGEITGSVYDVHTQAPIPYVHIFIHELNRNSSTLADGSFRFSALPAGRYHLHVSHIGYKDFHIQINIEPNKVTHIKAQLTPNSISNEAIVIVGDKVVPAIEQPAHEMSGKELRREMGSTLAETLADKPGLDLQSNGPAPARPVLRGLSGDRLLLLENGERAGDLSNTASDHAVTIEPATAERIEIIRGPMALTYGSNTLAGVINVVRFTPKEFSTKKVSGKFNLNGETVNKSVLSAGKITIPFGNFHFIADGSFRNTGHLESPLGTVKNSAIQTENGALTAMYNHTWGHAFIGYNLYHSQYGIPPAPEELGSHPDGVDIEINKNKIDVGLEIKNPFRYVKQIKTTVDRSHYYHYEVTVSGQDAEFSVETYHHTSRFSLTGNSVLKNTQLGYWVEHRNYRAGGRTNTPDSKETSLALFAYNELILGPFEASASARYEHKKINPLEKSYDERIGYIRNRSFDNLAGSIKLIYNVNSNLNGQFMLFKAFRAPGIEELFSDGPHTPSYAYELGNADLDAEQTYGLDFSINYNKGLFSLTSSVYFNKIDGYLFSQNTGKRSWRRYDLFRYQFVGLDSEIKGIELEARYDLTENMVINSSFSYLEGTLLEQYNHADGSISKTNQALPYMPPFSGKTSWNYKLNPFSFTVGSHYAYKQERTGRFEEPTDGYILFNADMEYFFPALGMLNILRFSVENIGNTTYRKHLNKIKAVFPEPGRSFKLKWHVLF